ncbi:7891_t:CDS:2 [Acaulospora morrowiae]|uniref:7891_t:CDS:1 n=1 Tax=Acaulospora morrowiae TaxID=94023 RepID=A0A9N9CWD0_9GLOM|nr:7891_t:CDS:2 [Acaulospora morrowiae]
MSSYTSNRRSNKLPHFAKVFTSSATPKNLNFMMTYPTTKPEETRKSSATDTFKQHQKAIKLKAQKRDRETKTACTIRITLHVSKLTPESY